MLSPTPFLWGDNVGEADETSSCGGRVGRIALGCRKRGPATQADERHQGPDRLDVGRSPRRRGHDEQRRQVHRPAEKITCRFPCLPAARNAAGFFMHTYITLTDM